VNSVPFGVRTPRGTFYFVPKSTNDTRLLNMILQENAEVTEQDGEQGKERNYEDYVKRRFRKGIRTEHERV